MSKPIVTIFKWLRYGVKRCRELNGLGASQCQLEKGHDGPHYWEAIERRD